MFGGAGGGGCRPNGRVRLLPRSSSPLSFFVLLLLLLSSLFFVGGFDSLHCDKLHPVSLCAVTTPPKRAGLWRTKQCTTAPRSSPQGNTLVVTMRFCKRVGKIAQRISSFTRRADDGTSHIHLALHDLLCPAMRVVPPACALVGHVQMR